MANPNNPMATQQTGMLARRNQTANYRPDGGQSPPKNQKKSKQLPKHGKKKQKSKKDVKKVLSKTYFVSQSTALMKQLKEFQDNDKNMALVVDEYGEIEGVEFWFGNYKVDINKKNEDFSMT